MKIKKALSTQIERCEEEIGCEIRNHHVKDYFLISSKILINKLCLL